MRTWVVPPAPWNPPALTPGPPWSCPKESKGKSHLPMSTLPAWRGRKSPGAREGATVWMFEENLSCRGSCTSCRCKFWDVSALGSKQSWVRRERRSRAAGWVWKGGAEVTGDQWDAPNPGAHGNHLHLSTAPTAQTIMSFGCYWPVLGSGVVFPEKILQQMSVYEREVVSGLITDPATGKIEEKPGTFPPFPSKSFFTPSCVFCSPVRPGVGGTGSGTVTSIGSLTRFQHTSLRQGFIFYILKKNPLPQNSLGQTCMIFHKRAGNGVSQTSLRFQMKYFSFF